MGYGKKAPLIAAIPLGLAGLAAALTPSGSVKAVETYHSQPVAVYDNNRLELRTASRNQFNYGDKQQIKPTSTPTVNSDEVLTLIIGPKHRFG